METIREVLLAVIILVLLYLVVDWMIKKDQQHDRTYANFMISCLKDNPEKICDFKWMAR